MCTTLLDEKSKKDILWSSSHIWVRRFRCGDSQRDYYAHDVQHSDAREGGKRGEEGEEGVGRDRMGWGGGRAGNTGITGSRLEQQTASEVGGHRAAAHDSRSWGTWGKRADREHLSYTQTHSLERGKQLAAWLSMSCDLFEIKTSLITEGQVFQTKSTCIYDNIWSNNRVISKIKRKKIVHILQQSYQSVIIHD